MSVTFKQSSAVGIAILQSEEGDAPIIVTVTKLLGAAVDLVIDRSDGAADDLIVNEPSVSLA